MHCLLASERDTIQYNEWKLEIYTYNTRDLTLVARAFNIKWADFSIKVFFEYCSHW